MSLLEEGIATGNVLPTGRKEKHSIDNVTRDFDIYRIKCDLLFYNDQNDRIATWVSEYNSAQGADLLALGRDEYNGVIEDFIVESNPGALRKTEKSIALRGQLRPGIVLNDGRVIDGNRRLTCVRRLARANNEAGWSRPPSSTTPQAATPSASSCSSSPSKSAKRRRWRTIPSTASSAYTATWLRTTS